MVRNLYESKNLSSSNLEYSLSLLTDRVLKQDHRDLNITNVFQKYIFGKTRQQLFSSPSGLV